MIAIAARLGLDVDRLRADMQDRAIDAYLDEMIDLGRKLGIDGTPAFVIGARVVPGAVGVERLKAFIAEARSAG